MHPSLQPSARHLLHYFDPFIQLTTAMAKERSQAPHLGFSYTVGWHYRSGFSADYLRDRASNNWRPVSQEIIWLANPERARQTKPGLTKRPTKRLTTSRCIQGESNTKDPARDRALIAGRPDKAPLSALNVRSGPTPRQLAQTEL